MLVKLLIITTPPQKSAKYYVMEKKLQKWKARAGNDVEGEIHLYYVD